MLTPTLEGSSNASFAAPWNSNDEGASEGTNKDTSERTIALSRSSNDEGGSNEGAPDDTLTAFATSFTMTIDIDELSEADATGGVSAVEDGEAASAVTAVTAGDAHATTAEAVPIEAAVSEYRLPKTDPVTAAGWIEAADEQFRVPDNIVEDLRKLASFLPKERAWVILYLITSRKATALAVTHLKFLRAVTSNTNGQQATSEYLILSRKATQLALQSLQDQNILNKDMEINEFFAKRIQPLNHDITASGDDSNEHLTASPRTPERIISRGGAKACATAPTSLLKPKQGCTVVNHATKRMTPKMSRSALVACSITARASAQSGRIYKTSLQRLMKISAVTCATSLRGERIMAIALLHLTKQAASFAGFAAIIIMKGLLKLTVHTATAIAYILRIAIVDAPPAIREFMHDVIKDAHALEKARRH
nr:hypothetical protein B0A51_05047 [Rachicladosporium sp. CCFEE 5018]